MDLMTERHEPILARQSLSDFIKSKLELKHFSNLGVSLSLPNLRACFPMNSAAVYAFGKLTRATRLSSPVHILLLHRGECRMKSSPDYISRAIRVTADDWLVRSLDDMRRK